MHFNVYISNFIFGNGSYSENLRSLSVRGAMYVSMSGVIIITVLGNLASIISVSCFKQLHSPTNFLILSMAVTDFLLGFFIMPFSMVRSVENCWCFGKTFCKIHYSFDLMLCLVSIFHLCCIAVDRFCAICYLLPASFAFGVIFSVAYASGIEGYEVLVVFMFNKLWGIILSLFGFFIPGALMIGVYVQIFDVSRKHLRSNLSRNTGDENPHQLSRRKDRKAAKTLSIVMGGFLFCWFPCFVTFLIDPFIGFSIPAVLFDALTWFGYLNSSCNPLIYGFFYP
uniref:G-protein coupled receptors family 1 profile domain-containing protein n=1 Tax=Varanus komodoensis TaxID=61221 RepID=A0A8D2L1S7_VARKO